MKKLLTIGALVASMNCYAGWGWFLAGAVVSGGKKTVVVPSAQNSSGSVYLSNSRVIILDVITGYNCNKKQMKHPKRVVISFDAIYKIKEDGECLEVFVAEPEGGRTHSALMSMDDFLTKYGFTTKEELGDKSKVLPKRVKN